MKKVKELLQLPEKVLRSLHLGKSDAGVEFVEKLIERHANGYYIDRVILRRDDSYYQFLAIRYLDDYMTFTVPYKVFKKEEEIIRTTYTNSLEVEV